MFFHANGGSYYKDSYLSQLQLRSDLKCMQDQQLPAWGNVQRVLAAEIQQRENKAHMYSPSLPPILRSARDASFPVNPRPPAESLRSSNKRPQSAADDGVRAESRKLQRTTVAGAQFQAPKDKHTRVHGANTLVRLTKQDAVADRAVEIVAGNNTGGVGYLDELVSDRKHRKGQLSVQLVTERGFDDRVHPKLASLVPYAEPERL